MEVAKPLLMSYGGSNSTDVYEGTFSEGGASKRHERWSVAGGHILKTWILENTWPLNTGLTTNRRTDDGFNTLPLACHLSVIQQTVHYFICVNILNGAAKR